VFGKAQPALLYLSPACITAFVATGAIRGELKIAWEWSDEAQVEKVAEKVAEKTAESPAAMMDSKSK
jgi:minor histocompatibility antigen H13